MGTFYQVVHVGTVLMTATSCKRNADQVLCYFECDPTEHFWWDGGGGGGRREGTVLMTIHFHSHGVVKEMMMMIIAFI